MFYREPPVLAEKVAIIIGKAAQHVLRAVNISNTCTVARQYIVEGEQLAHALKHSVCPLFTVAWRVIQAVILAEAMLGSRQVDEIAGFISSSL